MRELTEPEAFQVLAFMNKLVVGLDRIGSQYSDNAEDRAWALAYVFSPAVFKEAAQLRHLIGSKYSQELDERQDQDEVERLLADLSYWKMPTLKQLARFRQNQLKK
ncbi:hypothetical protein [Hymenobacter sp. UV11]|uniref:hypothetical protein n=2 Tax=Hymenobacter sp. UV11 TaxID=1849735 RepID=UPI0010F1D923|nr:hypothetical protein [Hymenobacter sp. UV11]TDN38082.1 hypothetical protein A8B98_00515 [Hymenobacter sp. UV11]